MITFHPYTKSNKEDFYNLNISWLKELFLLEPYDEFVLSNPKSAILDKGGYIFMGKFKGKIVATFALTPCNDGAYELNKMAVHETFRGKGFGNKIMEFLIQFGIEKNINVIELYSNKKLENAIHLYLKYGFVEVEISEDNPYQRCDIKMSQTLNEL
ncbi:MAG: GNAT family N-acetyltransferase [Flavobacteriales bacterium]|nr:GNAT family N-acetyltransferase [Flavobacteriales bacterium]